MTDCRREGWAFDEGDLRRKRRALSKLRSAVWQTVLGVGCVLWSLPAAAQEGVDFNRDVRPILAKACFVCHGNDPEHRQADLRLDSFEQATRDLGGHRAIVPGNAAESELFRRVSSDDEDLRMPPADAGERLTAHQVELLKRWIDAGAEYERHWSLVPPRQVEPPVVRDENWPRQAFDRFVLAELEQRGWEPAAEADRETLIRRVSLDLIGLPPSPAEVQAFVNDRSPDAYAELVNRLLESPRFGERWAQVWLDLARYSDSMGYEKDLPRTIWKYRDWVIEAYNNDMPFDQFTIEQIAGDMLPNASDSQRIATALHRNTLTNQEGGTDDEEFRVAAVKDRVDTTLQVWMGLTMGCAKCHSHKYDPISHEDYYSFFAIFNQTADADRGDDYPTLATPTPQEQARMAELDAAKAALETRLGQFGDAMREGYERWLGAEERGEVPARIVRLLEMPASERSENQCGQLKAWYARHVAPEHETLRTELAGLEAQRKDIKPVTTPVMMELPEEKRRTTRIHVRGNFLDPGAAVGPAVPGAYGGLPAGEAANRLSVARWLVSRENPLTARVQVNRYWARLFGRGLVYTEEDFGVQGMSPSHPELLDWLAVEFMEQGWSIKGLLKMLVTSATYRQASAVSEESLARDPENVWLGRGPRFRLEAEILRDQALEAAGLLSAKMLGPSVMPPQPPGIWKVTYSALKWENSEGEDRYRRGLYTFWRRTSPYPSMLTFDAGSRETCVLRRVRTNTPLQALVLMNDPVFVEAAGGLARRMVSEGGASTRSRAEFGFRLVLARGPREEELSRLVQLFEEALQAYGKDREAAEGLLESARVEASQGAVEELAAWVVVGNVLLNLDEAMVKP